MTSTRAMPMYTCATTPPTNPAAYRTGTGDPPPGRHARTARTRCTSVRPNSEYPPALCSGCPTCDISISPAVIAWARITVDCRAITTRRSKAFVGVDMAASPSRRPPRGGPVEGRRDRRECEASHPGALRRLLATAEATEGAVQIMTPSDPSLRAVIGERRRLINLGYRLLGSLAEAQDVVQETYVRWYAMSAEQQEAVESPRGWLTRVASRICLDVLGSARARRERYVGEWIPEPLPGPGGWGGGPPADPADRVTLDESVTMAFLVVLESMTPAERVAFVLHDVFGYPFAEVAEIVGRNPAACRQLASSARRRIRASPAPATATS